MKRIIICFMLFIMIATCVAPVSALSDQESAQIDREYLYEDAIFDCLAEEHKPLWIKENLLEYDELYYHEAAGECDWVLVKLFTATAPWFGKMGVNIGSRSVYSYGMWFVTTGYGVYVIAENKLYDVAQYEQFDGLREVVEELELGMPLGDVDFDNEVTILDATAIQRILAEIDVRQRYSFYDDMMDWVVGGDTRHDYISDYDRDGSRTILDATAIQRNLAGLE